MGLRKHAIEWSEAPEASRASTPRDLSSIPSPALELQALLQQHQAALTAPGIDREVMRRLLTMLAAGGVSVWLALILSANAAVSLVV